MKSKIYFFIEEYIHHKLTLNMQFKFLLTLIKKNLLILHACLEKYVNIKILIYKVIYQIQHACMHVIYVYFFLKIIFIGLELHNLKDFWKLVVARHG